MSNEPGPSNAPDPAPNAPRSRTIRGRRPTNLSSTNLPDQNESTPTHEVRILRPSQVPQRLPLAEYTEPEARRILPKDISMDELGELELDEIKKVVISNTIPAAQLLLRADIADFSGVISFRSTNYEDPIECARGSPTEPTKSFQEKNEHFLGTKVCGCTAYRRKDDDFIWDVIIEAPVPSIYEGSVFFVEIHFNRNNSGQLPAVKFKTLMFHPKLKKQGDYDMRELARKWKPTSNMKTIYEYLISDMQDLQEKIYNKCLRQIEAMAQPNIARLAAGDWDKFERIARSVARKMSGAHVNTTGTTSDAVLLPKFSLRNGYARSPSPEIDVIG